MAGDGSLTFRRAAPGDKALVEALCAKIWEGEDYLPRSFDAWVADEAGELTVCFAGDRLAGISKLTWLGPGEAWLEGLRKDPDVPVKGLGAALCKRYLARLARTEGLRSVRFSTYFQNHASIKLNEAIGFRRIATASLKELNPADLRLRASGPPAADPRIAVLRDADAALAFIGNSGWFGGFIHQAWRSYPWSPETFVRRYLEPGHCTALVEGGRIRAMAACLLDPIKGEGTLPFFDAEDADSGSALMAALERGLALDGARGATAIVPPGGARARALLDDLGWKTWEREEDYCLYEFPLERLEAYREP